MELRTQKYQLFHPNCGVTDREVGKVYGRVVSELSLEDLALLYAETSLNDEGELLDRSEWIAVRHKEGDPWQWFEVTAELSVDYRIMQGGAPKPDDDWYGYKEAMCSLMEEVL